MGVEGTGRRREGTVHWLKIIGLGALAAAGVAVGLALGRLPGAVLVALSLFLAVVVVGFAMARLVGAMEQRWVFARTGRRRAKFGSGARCRTCGRRRAHVDGVYVCRSCDGVTPTTGGVSENARPG